MCCFRSVSETVQSLLLASRVFRAAGARKLTTFLWLLGSGAFILLQVYLWPYLFILRIVFDHYNYSSTGYRVVLHVFNYSYRDSVSEQANYGSLAKAMEKALNCCNFKCIADSVFDKHKPVDRCTAGRFPEV